MRFRPRPIATAEAAGELWTCGFRVLAAYGVYSTGPPVGGHVRAARGFATGTRSSEIRGITGVFIDLTNSIRS